MKRMINQRMILLCALVMALFVVSCTKSVKMSDEQNIMAGRSEKSLNLQQMYTVELDPLNNSGVMGNAKLTLNGNMLTVQIDATGLEAGKLHPQHIHGFMDGRKSKCPTMAADTNGDGIITLEEGFPSYGAVLLELTPFPTADQNGEVHYMQTFPINASLLPLQNRGIVLHGKTVMGQYWPTLPVACGEIKVGSW